MSASIKYIADKLAGKNSTSPGHPKCFKKSRQVYQPTLKEGCTAKISVRYLVLFPDFEIKGERTRRKEGFMRSFLLNHNPEEIRCVHQYQVQFPGIDSHSNHLLGSLSRQVDQFVCAEVKNRIKKMMDDGVRSISEMKRLVEVHV